MNRNQLSGLALCEMWGSQTEDTAKVGSRHCITGFLSVCDWLCPVNVAAIESEYLQAACTAPSCLLGRRRSTGKQHLSHHHEARTHPAQQLLQGRAVWPCLELGLED